MPMVSFGGECEAREEGGDGEEGEAGWGRPKILVAVELYKFLIAEKNINNIN